MIVLPPKRFQDPSSPCYDPIRHLKWFGKLSVRRDQITMLRCALRDYDDTRLDLTQKEICARWKVSEREFRDYIDFVAGFVDRRLWQSPAYQPVMDAAYASYCNHLACRHIRHFIEEVAPLYGLNKRHVTERWEVDPGFIPTGYNIT